MTVCVRQFWDYTASLPWAYVGLCRTIRLYVRLCDARRAYMSLWHYLSIISTLWVLFPDSWHPMHALRTICDAREPPESLKMFLGLLWIFYKMEIYTKSAETISDRCAKLILFKVCRRMLALAFSSKTPIYPIYLSSLSNPSKLSNLSNHVSSVYLVWSVSEVSIAKCLSCAECYMSLWHYLSIILTLWLLFPGSWRPMHAVRTLCDAREPPESLKMFLGLLWSQ